MQRMCVCCGMAFCLLTPARSAEPAPPKPPLATAQFADNGAELTNPGMGWALHYYDNIPRNYGSRLEPSDRLTDWPGLGFLYLRIPWSYIEPEENVFNWTLLDTPMERFRSRGLQAGFRITCSESWCEYATPKWVKTAGAKGYRFRPGAGTVKDGPYWEPDFDDPVFLDKLDHFLAVMAARYDGRDDVAFVEVGSFGVWGEGHTWASSKKVYPNQTIIRHIDLYRKHFRKTPILGMDDFLSRPRPPLAWRRGLNKRGFDMVIIPEWYGHDFLLRAGLWRPGNVPRSGRLLPYKDDEERTTHLGILHIDAEGRARFDAETTELPSVDHLGKAEFAVVCTDMRYDADEQPHSLKIPLRYRLARKEDDKTHPFLHLLDPQTNKELWGPRPEAEDDQLTSYMADHDIGLRDDSILVQGGANAYYHATMAQKFWRHAMVAIESEHYGGSVARGCWGDGSAFLFAVEDYHAAYASIHWWPHEFLQKNRELVRRINLRIGYRFQLRQMHWPTRLYLDQPFPVRWSWRNAGVAPPYTDYYPCVTLKDADGGVAAVFVDTQANLRHLPVSLHAPPEQTFSRTFTLPLFLPVGTYAVFVSVGDCTGHPRISLPLDRENDGEKRYRIGSCVIQGDYNARVADAAIDASNALRLDTVWTVHHPLNAAVRVFFHLDHGGKLAWAGGPETPRFTRVGDVPVSVTIPLPQLAPGESATVHAGLWQPQRAGRADERCVPDAGAEDRRVRLGVVRADDQGKLTFIPADRNGSRKK